MDKFNLKVYAARAKKQNILTSSSSGGLFTILSDAMLESGGAILAAVYDYQNHIVSFRLIRTVEERDAAKGSKYVQSNMADAFYSTRIWLEGHPDKKLMFIGLGCQADAFRNFIESVGLRERVWIVDIICHGVPSPQIWKEYIAPISPQYVTFKDKRKGWLHPTAVAYSNGKEIPLDEYVRVYYQHSILRPSCYSCPYSTLIRTSDITIGDYWHIQSRIPEFFHPMGNQLVIIHTELGLEIWDRIHFDLDICDSYTENCLQNNLVCPTLSPKNRAQFWHEWHKKGTMSTIHKYGMKKEEKSMNKVKRKLKKVFKILVGGVRII